MDPFLGQIQIVGFNFAPTGWAQCDGQLMAISQNTALFSLLGIQYGGDGRSTYALPDLRGRLPMSFGNGPGLTPRVMGEAGGTETETLLLTEIPAHTHPVVPNCYSVGGDSTDPTGHIWSKDLGVQTGVYATPTNLTPMNSQSVTIAQNGGNQPHNNLMPYLAMNFIIALIGVFPARS